MTSSPPPPNRRWRQIVIALVLVSLCAWWCWPREDARFVGKWINFQAGNSVPYVLELHSNGSGTYDPAPTSIGELSFGGRKSHFRWKIADDRLQVHGWKSDYLNNQLNSWVIQFTGRTFMLPERKLAIVFADGSQLHYRDENGNLQAWGRLAQ